jgi:multicomponent Na+:H+ antiporter subunit D
MALVPSALKRVLALAVFAAGFSMGLTALPVLLAQGGWHYNLGGWAPPWGIELVLTPFTLFLAGLGWLVGLGAWFYGLPFWVLHRGEGKKEGAFYAFLFLLSGTFLGFLTVRDLFSLYLLLQLSVAAGALLLALGQGRGWLDAFRFLLWGGAGNSFFLLAVFFLYASTGTFHLGDILAQIFIAKNAALVTTAGCCLALGLSQPLLFPSLPVFRSLLERTPAFLLGLLVSLWTRGAVYLAFTFLFFTLNLPSYVPPKGIVLCEYSLVVVFLALFVLAMRQKDLLKALGHLGTAQLGVLFAGFLLGNKGALTGTLMDLSSQVLVMAGFFFAAGMLRSAPGALPFSRLAGLGRHQPLMGLSLVIFAASVAGVPPTGGSFGKWYLVQGALEKKDWVLLAALAASVLFGLFYFVRWTVLLYEHRSASGSLFYPSRASQVFLFLLALAVLLLGLFHQAIIHDFIEPALPKAFQDLPIPNVPFLGKEVE